MKTAILFFSLLVGGFAHAQVIADTFECRAKIVDLKTNDTAESVGMAAGHRIVTPIDSSTGQPYPSNMEVSKGEAKLSLALNGKINSYKVDFNLQYGFAKRSLPNPTEARQYVCNQVTLQSCQNGEMGSCAAASTICVVIPDPFDPKYGWSETILIQKVPVFNEKLLRPLDTIVPIDPNDPNGARVTVSCKFQGTYL
ncbi:MAG: hypothetical protein KF802_08920 [Bdellovibrionaceae bacterium]|nr:hypothetical protein [Pseudobdellovibrionaceae bacterium]